MKNEDNWFQARIWFRQQRKFGRIMQKATTDGAFFYYHKGEDGTTTVAHAYNHIKAVTQLYEKVRGQLIQLI